MHFFLLSNLSLALELKVSWEAKKLHQEALHWQGKVGMAGFHPLVPFGIKSTAPLWLP